MGLSLAFTSPSAPTIKPPFIPMRGERGVDEIHLAGPFQERVRSFTSFFIVDHMQPYDNVELRK